jgi:hypothetical protein
MGKSNTIPTAACDKGGKRRRARRGLAAQTRESSTTGKIGK